LFFSCCGSVAAPRQLPGHHEQVPAKNNGSRGHRPRHHDQVTATHNGRRRWKRPGHHAQLFARRRGQRPGHHAQVPARRREQRPSSTMKYIRCTTSAAAGNGLGITINENSPAMHNERRREQRPGYHAQLPATHNERRRGQRPGAAIQYLRCTTSGAAGNGLAPRSSTCAALQASSLAP
jgi:hypothetical protein